MVFLGSFICHSILIALYKSTETPLHRQLSNSGMCYCPTPPLFLLVYTNSGGSPWGLLISCKRSYRPFRFQNDRVGSDKNSRQKTNPDPSGDDSGLRISIWSYIWYLLALVSTTESLHHHFCCSLHRLGIHLESANSKPWRSDFRDSKEMEIVEILLRLLSYAPD